MSERNVELIRRFVEAYNARDAEALISYCGPSIELHSIFAAAGVAAAGGRPYRGHEELRKWMRDVEDAWGHEIRTEAEAYFDLGEQTLSFMVFRGRGRESGAEVTMSAAVVFRCRDGLIVYVKGYTDRDQALGDLGLTTDELEPIAP